jgi:Holliday junction resolvase-like predicted endonuclease
MTENKYQAKLIKRLENIFPGCVILKMDTSYQQGMLDLIILWKNYWASLEVKSSKSASSQPNQDYYIERLSEMSFAAYIYPENEEEVLIALQQAFKPPRRTRVS